MITQSGGIPKIKTNAKSKKKIIFANIQYDARHQIFGQSNYH